MTAEETIAALGVKPHPEGGWYAEIHRDPPEGDARRGARTSIHYPLTAASRWRRVDATEIWCRRAGAPLELRMAPAGARQAARTLGARTMVGCIAAPAIGFEGFELASSGWEPPG